jgi:O6-methylguanine-DNA--protein-cysteine methyltransferase
LLVARVVGLIEAPRLGLDLPFDVRGTAFQQRVWKALRDIPAGRTATYSDIARKIFHPNRCVRSLVRARPTILRWRSLATVWYETMVRFPAIGGASNASAF